MVTTEKSNDITVMGGNVYFWTDGGGWILLEDMEDNLEDEYPWGIATPIEQVLRAAHTVCDEYITLKEEYDQLFEKYMDLQKKY